jgi:hypothetical protein
MSTASRGLARSKAFTITIRLRPQAMVRLEQLRRTQGGAFQADRNSLADRLIVELTALAERANVALSRPIATLLGQADEVVLLVHVRRGTAAGPGRSLVPTQQ